LWEWIFFSELCKKYKKALWVGTNPSVDQHTTLRVEEISLLNPVSLYHFSHFCFFTIEISLKTFDGISN
jgi:hypothetical protein